MALRWLDHINIRTTRLEAMTQFYRDVLGLRVGPRPAFSFGGAWLYCEERPVVHLVSVARQPAHVEDLQIEHFAFRADRLDDLAQRLDRAGIAYTTTDPNDFGIRQLHVRDPDENHIHIDVVDS